MIRITDNSGYSVESIRDHAERQSIAKILLRRSRELLRDIYTPAANDLKRGLDDLIRRFVMFP